MLNVKRNVISQQQQSFLDDERKDRVMSMAIGEAAKFSLATSAIVGTGTYLASVHIPKFAKFMSISAKVSLPVMATLFVGTLKFELAIHDMQRNPEKWGLSDEIIQARKVSLMPWHHKVLNYIYDNHYVLIVGLGVPFVGAVLNEQLKLKHITISQRIMHSRVFGQAGVLTIALTTMAFREIMNRRGRFPEPEF